MSSEETNSIEEKKNDSKGPTTNDWTSYSSGVIGSIVYIILFVWILGTCMLYTTKVAKSNIIPNDLSVPQSPINVNANYVREFVISTEKPYVNIGERLAQELKFIKTSKHIGEYLLDYLKLTFLAHFME